MKYSYFKYNLTDRDNILLRRKDSYIGIGEGIMWEINKEGLWIDALLSSQFNKEELILLTEEELQTELMLRELNK